MNDPFQLHRFIEAQNSKYNDVVDELRRGRKRSCWIWFVFPQVVGLGRSPTAEKFSIKSFEEAKAYYIHPVLGGRLKECTKLVLKIDCRSVNQIFSFPDDLKFRSSMTLFKYVANGNKLFQDAINKFYEGNEDPLTLEVLKKWKKHRCKI